MQVVERRIFFLRSLRGCEFVARSEAMKREESFGQDVGGMRES